MFVKLSSFQVFKLSRFDFSPLGDSFSFFGLSIFVCFFALIVHLWETRFPFLDRPSLPLVGLLDSFSERKMEMLVKEKKIVKMGLMKLMKIVVLIDMMRL